MRHDLLLAWRYLTHHRVRSVLLALGIVLTALLPLSVQLLVRNYGAALRGRAQATPLVVGAPGSRYDLVLGALYFRGRPPRATSMAELEALRDSGLALAIPILARRTARGLPVVGTSHDYYGFRDLRFATGRPPALLGDAVLGAHAATQLGLGIGDRLLTDRGSLYDLAAGYPMRLEIVGVLEESDSPDDSAVLVDVKSTWIIEGIAHGHDDARALDPDALLGGKRRAGEVVLNASVVEYTEVTPENIDSFHLHAAPDSLPLTAVLLDPVDAKSSTLLKGRYRVAENAQLIVPTVVIDELTGFVFRLKRFFDANVALVSLATLLFLTLVVMLELRARRPELETLRRIGCARSTVFRLIATEMGLTVGAGLLAAALLATVVVRAAGHWGGLS